MMSRTFTLAAALAILTSPVLAGGWGGHKSASSPQFAHATALNYSKQIATSKTLFNVGKVEQTAGASADAYNKSKCRCKGVQKADAFAKNNSLQVATVTSGINIGGISQTAVASASATNIRR